MSTYDGAVRRRSLAAALAAVTVAGVAFGLTLPLLGLLMEEMGVSTTLIGLNTAMPAIAVLVVTPAIPRLVTRFGVTRFLLVSLGLSVGCLLLYKVLENVWIWFPLRFLQGVGAAGLFTVSEIWINEMAEDSHRGRVLGLYVTLMAGGFALGPAILPLTGVEGWAPFIAGAVVHGLAAIPILLARRTPPEIAGSPSRGVLAFVTVAPVATLAALVYGAVETGIFDLLPIYGVRVGFEAELAALLLTAVAAGNVVLQLPIGWLADRVDRRALMVGCALVGVAGALSLPFVLAVPILLWPSLLLWGGSVVGLYTVGLTLLGERFSGPDLAAANSAFVMMYGIGAVLGPPAVGVAMDLYDPHGLPLMLGLLCGAFVLVVLAHRARRRLRGDGQ